MHCAICLLSLAVNFTVPARAGSFIDQFKDEEDGRLDASDWVLENAAMVLA